jgi:hypothetical protein
MGTACIQLSYPLKKRKVNKTQCRTKSWIREIKMEGCVFRSRNEFFYTKSTDGPCWEQANTCSANVDSLEEGDFGIVYII